MPEYSKEIIISDVEGEKDKIIEQVDLVFSAMNLDAEKIREIEEYYAGNDIAVVSNNSAHR